MYYLCTIIAVVAQLVEHWLPKPRVAGSSPVYRSIACENLRPINKEKRCEAARVRAPFTAHTEMQPTGCFFVYKKREPATHQ